LGLLLLLLPLVTALASSVVSEKVDRHLFLFFRNLLTLDLQFLLLQLRLHDGSAIPIVVCLLVKQRLLGYGLRVEAVG